MPEIANERPNTYLGLLDGQDIPEGYEHYIWMSDRCLEGIAFCTERRLDYGIVPSHNATAAEIEEDHNYLNEVRLEVLKYATQILNEYHHTAYRMEQWRVMLNTWMEKYLMEYYDKYRRLQYVERLGVNCECNLYGTDADIPILDFSDYSLLVSTDAYQLYQYSRLFEAMKPLEHIGVRRREEYGRPPITKSSARKPSRKYRLYRSAVQALDRLGNTSVVLYDSYLPEKFLLKLMLKHPGKIVNYNAICNYAGEERDKIPVTIDTAWRNSAEDLPEGLDAFTTLMCAMLKRELPIAYVESFPYLQQRAKVLYRHATHPKAILFVSGASSGMETFKAYLMEQKGTDALLCGIQHGSGYGEWNDSLIACIYELCDMYYTWGWSRERNEPYHFKPMPAAKMVGLDAASEYDGDDILYVSYCDPKNAFFIAATKDELQEERTFLQSLSPENRRRFRYRPYPSDCGWNFYSDVKKSIPDLRFDSITGYYDSLAASKIMITSIFATTALEALWLNKPIIAVRRKRYPIDPEAKADIEAMYRVGVFVYDFDELAERLEEVLPDIDGWWNEPERQEVVRRFRDKYVFMPPNAEKLWEKELLRLANGK